MTALRRLPFLLLLAWLLSWPLASQAQPTPYCGVPLDFVEQGIRLPRAAKAIATGQLRVLAIGSAAGPAGKDSANAWPYRLVAALESRQPGLKVELTLRAERGSTATDQFATLTKSLAQTRFDLVIWQTGTVEAVRGTEPQEMADAVEQGIAKLRAAGIDVMLMDQQFSRFLRANTQIDTYRDMLRLVASAQAVPLLRRYELMQLWSDTDRLDLERTPKAQLPEAWDRLHDCLGRALARIVLRAVAL